MLADSLAMLRVYQYNSPFWSNNWYSQLIQLLQADRRGPLWQRIKCGWFI